MCSAANRTGPKNKKPAERFRASGLMSASYEFASHTAAGTVSCDDGDDGAPEEA